MNAGVQVVYSNECLFVYTFPSGWWHWSRNTWSKHKEATRHPIYSDARSLAVAQGARCVEAFAMLGDSASDLSQQLGHRSQGKKHALSHTHRCVSWELPRLRLKLSCR